MPARPTMYTAHELALMGACSSQTARGVYATVKGGEGWAKTTRTAV